jgi:hypothetical protein
MPADVSAQAPAWSGPRCWMAKAILVAAGSAWVRTLVSVVRNPEKPHIGVLKKEL